MLAAGNPLGLPSSITDGIVSALGRNVSEGQGVVLPNATQTSAAINPGNRGGALVDLAGQVIGIPTLAAADPQLALGISLADSVERPGALVGAVQPGGPAERSGLAVGDSISAIAGKDVAKAEALGTALGGLFWGSPSRGWGVDRWWVSGSAVGSRAGELGFVVAGFYRD